MQAKFCPFCQRKNKNNAVRCEHCGVLLISQEANYYTTVNINDISEPAISDLIPCSERISELPENCFALFLLEFEEPIIVPIHPKTILGRDDENTTDNTVDFSRFGDVTMGISRRHAIIHYNDNEFTLEDMGSTNGTWLNRHRLMPGENHPLKNEDQIWLGPLKMVFCQGINVPKKSATFWLKEDINNRKSRRLLPEHLIHQVGPFLQALFEVDHIRSSCLGKTENGLSLESIIQDEGYLGIKLSKTTDTIEFVASFVINWRQDNQEFIGVSKIDEDAQKSLSALALQMIESLVPELSPAEKAAQADMLVPPVGVLATNPLGLLLTKPA